MYLQRIYYVHCKLHPSEPVNFSHALLHSLEQIFGAYFRQESGRRHVRIDNPFAAVRRRRFIRLVCVYIHIWALCIICETRMCVRCTCVQTMCRRRVVFQTLKRLFRQTFKSNLICFLTFPRSKHAYIYYKIATHRDPPAPAPSSTTRYHPNTRSNIIPSRRRWAACERRWPTVTYTYIGRV